MNLIDLKDNTEVYKEVSTIKSILKSGKNLNLQKLVKAY